MHLTRVQGDARRKLAIILSTTIESCLQEANRFMESQFKDKVVVITGGAGYFGSCAVKRFLGLGAKVTALDLSEDALATLPATSDCLKISGNVADLNSVNDAVARIMAAFGRIDYLWNNAGYQGSICPTLTYSIDDFSRVMNINVTGMFSVLQACAKVMQPGSAIVNTASVAGIKCTPAMVAYRLGLCK